MNEHTAVIIGASGLIGSNVLDQMLYNDHFTTVRMLVRQKLAINHPKLQQEIVDFNNRDDYAGKFGKGDSIFCCVGTTQKKVKGDKTLYEKIDHDIPVNAAAIGITNGFKKFLIISSVGADVSSRNFYLQLKGKTENAVRQFPFGSISIFRPSMLLGKRKESRPAEKAGQLLMRSLSYLFIGRLKKYHPINAGDVAKAMIAESRQNHAGIHILEYNEMMKLIR